MKVTLFILLLSMSSVVLAQIQTIMDFDQTSNQLAPEELVYFQSGVFEIDETGFAIIPKCIRTGGKWVRVEEGYPECEVDPATGKPPASERIKSGIMPVGSYMLFRHWGVDGSPAEGYADWDRVQCSAGTPDCYNRIRMALQMDVSDDGFQWAMDTGILPDAMRVRIPGSGLHAHLGELFPLDTYKPFANPTSKLKIKLLMGVPRYAMEGEGKGNITIGISFHVYDINGTKVPLTLNVNVLNTEGEAPVDTIATDTRSLYARTGLVATSQFITPLTTSSYSPPSDIQNYAFYIDEQDFLNLIQQFNQKRVQKGLTRIDEDFESVYLRGINVKNEITHFETSSDNVVLTVNITEFTAQIRTPQ